MKDKKKIDIEFSEKRLEFLFGKRNSFPVPEDYFNSLPSVVMQRIQTENTNNAIHENTNNAIQKNVHFARKRWLIPSISAMAAALIGLLFLFAPFSGSFYGPNEQKVANLDSNNSLNSEYYFSHILYNLPYSHILNSFNQDGENYLDSVIDSRGLIPDGALKEEEVIDYLYYHMSVYDLTQY